MRQRSALERLRALAHVPGEKATRKRTDDRVEVIFAMMRDGTWRSGKSARELAELWGLGIDRVEQLSATASKMLRRVATEHFEDRQAILLEIQHTLARLAFKAEQIGTPNALDVAGRNIERLGKYLGLEPAMKQEHTGPGGTPLAPTATMVAALVREAFGEKVTKPPPTAVE